MKRTVAFVAIALIVLCGLYFFFDPTHSPWAPKCIFRLLTGFDCPACGGQRALHALMHGEWQAALRFNPYLLVALPYLLVVAYTTFVKTPHAQRWRNWVQHRYTIFAFLALTVAWWIVRNLI